MKKGQIFSADLIMGTVVFILALGMFYGLSSSYYAETTASFRITGDSVFNAIDMDDNAKFMEDGYRVKENMMASYVYAEFEKVIETNIINAQNIKKIDGCIFFVEAGTNKVLKEIQSVGKIFLIQSNGDEFNCGGNLINNGELKTVKCEDYKYNAAAVDANNAFTGYTHASHFIRPVVYEKQSGGGSVIANMHVILCGVSNV